MQAQLNLRILIVEDLPSDAELVRRETLKVLPDADFRVVETETDFLYELSEFKPDLILSDYSMPKFTGLRALRLTLDFSPETPVIIVTGSINEDTAVDCMKAGAANYVIKDQMKRLGPAIRHALEEKQNLLEKMRAQAELERERFRFNALAENSFDIMTILSAEGEIIYESSATMHILGYRAGMRVGQNVFASVHPDDAANVVASFTQLATGEINRAQVEFRFKHENGSWVWFEASGQNLLSNPYLQGILVNSRDISERKKAEEKLRANQEFLTGIIENSDNLIFVKDIQGRYELVNKKWEATTGLNRLQVLGQIDSEVFPNGEGDRFRENDQLIFETKSVVDVEEILGSGDSARYFQSIKFPLFDANGNMNLMCGMSRDITERRKMQQELKISEEKFKNIFNNTPAGLYRTAVDGKVIDVNPALLKMLGYSDLEHLQSKSVFDIYVDLEEKKRFDLQMESKGKFTGISQWYRSDGSIIWLEEQATAFKDENGAILYYDGSVINVTENKHAQDKLLDSELKYRTLFEGAGDAIMIMRGNCFIDCNAAAENMFVLSRDKIIKSTPVLLSPEKQRNGEASDVLAAKYTSMAINNSRYVFEWLHKRADDSVFDAEVSLQLVEIQGEKLLQAIVRDVTERKQLLYKVSESEEKYRLLFENITQGFANHEIVFDENGNPIDYRFLSVNPAFEKLTGLVAQNIIGKTFRQVLPEGEIDWLNMYADVAITGKSAQFENYSKPLGKYYEVFAFSPRKNEFAVVFHETTDRVLAAKKLKESEEKYRIIAENTADTITILDFDFKYLFSSPSIKRMLGYSVDEILKLEVAQIIHPDSIEIIHQLMREEMEMELSGLADPNRSRTVVLKEFHKDGSSRWIESTASFIRDENGTPLNILAVSRDVTERKKEAELLAKSQEEFKAIFENNASAIAILNTDTTIVMVNDAFGDISGYTMEEIVGRSWTSLIATDDLEKMKEYNRLRLENPAAVPDKYEFSFFRKNGELRYALMSVALIPSSKKIVASFSDITERRNIEKALIESEIRYRAIFNNSVEGIYQTTPDGRYRTINPSFASMYGYSSAEEMIADVKDIQSQLYANPKDRDVFIEMLMQPNYIVRNFEAQMKRKDGSLFWVSINGKMMQSEDGGDAYIEGTCFDISERKIAEDKLRQSNAFLDSVVENIPNMLFVKDADTLKFVRINNAGERLMGFSAEQMIGKSDFDFFPQKEAEFFTQKDREVLLSKEPLDIPEEIISSNQLGNRILHTRKVPILDVEGNPLYLLGISEDITEQKEAAAKIKESEEKFRNMFENSPVGKSMTGIDGSMVVNKSFCNIVGYSETELKAGKWVEITHPDDMELSNSIVKQLLEGEKSIDRFEKRYIHKNGNVIWADVSVYLQKDKAGLPLFFITTIFDITERKSLLEALKAGEAKYRSYVESAPYGVFVTDEKGNYLEVNPAASRITGFSKAELLNMNIIDFMTDNYIEIGYKPFQGLGLDVVKTAEIPFLHKSGQIRWWTFSAVKLSENKFLGFTEDVTEKKNADLLLHESEEKFKNLAESSPFAIMIYQNAKWVYSNPAGERISGFAMDELVKMNFWEFVHPEDIEMVKNKGMLRQAGEATDTSYEFRIISKNGELKWVFLTGTSILYQEKTAGLVSIADISERKKAEEALNKSRQLFESLANMAPVGIFRTDPEGATTYVNPKWCEMSGLTYDEALGDGWLNSLVTEDVENIKEGWYRTVRERTTSIAEYRFQHADGEIVWVYGKAIPEVIDGMLNGYIGTITDFTERKKAEIELIESRQLFESLSNMSPVGIFRTDAKGFTTYVNPKWIEITGLSEREAMGKQWYKAIHPDDFMQSIVGWDNAVLKEGESIAEFRFFHSDGKVRWVFGKAVPERKDGELVGYIGTITDITERKLFENTLIENEKNLKRAEMVAGFGNWAFDLNNNFVRVSEGASQIYGLEDRQYLIPEIQKIPLPEYREALDLELEMLIAGEKDYDIEFEITRQSDNQRRLIHSIAEYDLQSNMIFGVIRDITEKKQMELALLNHEKQEKELVERELAKTQDALVRSTRLAAVGQISATIAHDLRNPLGAVRNAAYYLKRKLSNVDPKVFNYFNIIDGEIETADKIISNLLQMAKVKEPEKVQNDFREVIALATGEQYAKLNIAITVQLDKEPFILQVDKVQIVQVVRNLLENSSHAGVDKVVVDIRGQHFEEEVELIFCDNGPGISQDVRDSLFEPLITTKAKGTGLGLTICKQIIEKHGGTISLVDKPEMGACFRIVLPLK